jgi:hypothetical protein
MYELIIEFDQPNGVFALAEAIATIETAWAEEQDHFVRVAFIEVIIALVNRRVFLDVAEALVLQMLGFDRDRNSLTTAAKVAEWSGNLGLAAELNAEAALAPDLLPVPQRPAK